MKFTTPMCTWLIREAEASSLAVQLLGLSGRIMWEGFGQLQEILAPAAPSKHEHSAHGARADLHDE